MLHTHRLAGSLESLNSCEARPEAGLAACRGVCSISGDILGCCTRTGLLGFESLNSCEARPEAGLAACRGVCSISGDILGCCTPSTGLLGVCSPSTVSRHGLYVTNPGSKSRTGLHSTMRQGF